MNNDVMFSTILSLNSRYFLQNYLRCFRAFVKNMDDLPICIVRSFRDLGALGSDFTI